MQDSVQKFMVLRRNGTIMMHSPYKINNQCIINKMAASNNEDDISEMLFNKLKIFLLIVLQIICQLVPIAERRASI